MQALPCTFIQSDLPTAPAHAPHVFDEPICIFFLSPVFDKLQFPSFFSSFFLQKDTFPSKYSLTTVLFGHFLGNHWTTYAQNLTLPPSYYKLSYINRLFTVIPGKLEKMRLECIFGFAFYIYRDSSRKLYLRARNI